MKHTKKHLILFVVTAYSIINLPAYSQSPNLRTKHDGKFYKVEILLDGQNFLTSPSEGLWSIASSWKQGWPADWIHCKPTEIEHIENWTILRGKLETSAGTWRISDSYRPEGNIIKCIRRFIWEGRTTAKFVTLSVRFQCPGKGSSVLLPGILYHGNPSGARSGRVPVYSGQTGEEAIFEEHRFPMPYASLEWKDNKSMKGAALHSVPSPVPYGNLYDQWWSLGLIAKEHGTEYVLLSGPCASNGRRSVIKASQSGFITYDNAYLNVPPGAIIEKTFYLEAYPVKTKGSGFQCPTKTSLDIFSPYSLEGLPSFKEIIKAKYRFSKTRWHEEGNIAGFNKYPDRSYFVFGWCGQTAAPGYALQLLAEELGDSKASQMAIKSLDFLSSAEFYDKGFYTWYDHKKHRQNQYLSLLRFYSSGTPTQSASQGWNTGPSTTCTTR